MTITSDKGKLRTKWSFGWEQLIPKLVILRITYPTIYIG